IPVALTEGMKNVLVSGASPAIIGMLTVSAYLYPNMPVQFPLSGKIRISVIFVVQILIMLLYLVFAPNQTAIILAQTGSMIFSMLYARSFRNGNDWLRPFLRKKTFRVATDESQIRRIQVKIMHGRALQDDEYNTLR